MRALVIDARTAGERSGAKRERQSDHVIGVDQIVRRRAQIELREHGTRDAELDPVAGATSSRSEEWKLVGDADGGDVAREVALASLLIGGEGAHRFGVSDERTEHVAARQGDIVAL